MQASTRIALSAASFAIPILMLGAQVVTEHVETIRRVEREREGVALAGPALRALSAIELLRVSQGLEPTARDRAQTEIALSRALEDAAVEGARLDVQGDVLSALEALDVARSALDASRARETETDAGGAPAAPATEDDLSEFAALQLPSAVEEETNEDELADAERAASAVLRTTRMRYGLAVDSDAPTAGLLDASLDGVLPLGADVAHLTLLRASPSFGTSADSSVVGELIGERSLPSVLSRFAQAFENEALDEASPGLPGDCARLHSEIEEFVSTVPAFDDGEREHYLARGHDLVARLGALASAALAEGDTRLARRAIVARDRFQTSLLLSTLVALITSLAVGLTLRSVIKPLSRLSAASERIAAGELDTRLGITTEDEIGTLARSFDRMAESIAARDAELQEHADRLEEKIAERTADLRASREQLKAVLEATHTLPWQCEPGETHLAYIGSRAAELFGGDPEAWATPEFWTSHVPAEGVEAWRAAVRAASAGEERDFEFRFLRDDGRQLCIRAVAAGTEIAGRRTACGFMVDVTEQRKLELELRQAQKLESVGRLASGVAHEINTPIQFVSDSVHFVKESMGDVVSLLGDYAALQAEVSAGGDALMTAERVRARAEEIDIEYVVDNAPKALDRALEGLGRVAGIVRSMKTFAHADREEMSAVDLNDAVRATLTMARNEYKYVADAEMELGELPHVTCHAGEINQALLNLVVNASHAIEEVVRGTDRRGRITVRTRVDGDDVVIAVEDTGGGIPVAVRDRIFDPFFTTKGVGRGTGQGLTISRTSIVDRHRGALTFETELGRGTTFFVRLPVAGAQRLTEAA